MLWPMLRLIACGLGLSIAAAAHPESIATTQVFGPEIPGKYKHPASFTELSNGDLYLAYYGGGGEYEENSKVWGSRLAKSASNLSK